ncbi:G-type lectin S-receptor-like serine/threonine-protein kinase SD1-1 [Durio zibethinus]|uniref:non-specific serine/threonine protein kinase n=1 Tax=Durio zibethinus TaxID=66656 RepID=A0A6P5WNI2_DURZI|nr:G-type lectin S-receptor-like serine/threonine-protein kinase SD1-1 [Durio zibethinus]
MMPSRPTKKMKHEPLEGFLKCIGGSSSNNQKQKEDPELPLFDKGTIAHATKNFCNTNKLGEGGFGSVCKDLLRDGQEIAVKRLSENSKQGLNEFKNEVLLIAKLQHRNLVKLLGSCIEGDEKMLIYEFMPNKSLNFFLFDQAQSLSLDWPKRYNIINGIARGLLYLHQDSRQRIIHRDLKAGNILQDSQLNPKISAFGLARSFGENETKEKTKKVVGTYGYMSREYAIDGLYSIKSDVFSFGVLVLEIVSGQRNRGFTHPDHHHNLLGHAWKLYAEGKSVELIAAPIRDNIYLSEVLRSIHIGLLCVQRSPEDRPSMSNVVLMLGGESPLPQPKQPGFFSERDLVEASASSSYQKPCSYDEFTITLMEGR